MSPQSNQVRAIVFDLDGTLYVSPEFAATIQSAAAGYIAGLKGITPDQANHLMVATRRILAEESGEVPTLSAVSTRLGGDVRDLHLCFAEQLRPEAYLARDERVVALLEGLARRMPLYLFTNNNRILTARIIDVLGLNGLFRRTYAIDDSWKGKPDEDLLDSILGETGLKPTEVLFVGDRYDVDLRLPEQRGCPVYLSQSVDQLLRIEDILGRVNSR